MMVQPEVFYCQGLSVYQLVAMVNLNSPVYDITFSIACWLNFVNANKEGSLNVTAGTIVNKKCDNVSN
jgi:hypothetical protein